MKARALACLLGAVAALSCAATPAFADVSLESFDVAFTDENGLAALNAGSHPFAMTTTLRISDEEVAPGILLPTEAVKNLAVAQIPGLTGIPSAARPCSTLDFLTLVPNLNNAAQCPPGSAVGTVKTTLGSKKGEATTVAPVYNLEPPFGSPAKLGFWAQGGVPVTVDIGLSEEPPYNVVATTEKISTVLQVLGAQLTIWGVPADSKHDAERGTCRATAAADLCPAGAQKLPFLVLPRACQGALETSWSISSWLHPDVLVSGGTPTHNDLGNPEGMNGCGALEFNPDISARPTSHAADSASGLDLEVDIADEGISSADGKAGSDIKKTVVTLPEGVTINPSQAEGLATCSEAQLAAETSSSAPGEGCPQASKIGTMEVETPILPGKTLDGELFVATPFENRFGSLIALFMVIKDAELGVAFKLAGEVEPDPRTGQIVTTFDDLPQQPVSHFRVHLRSGARSPLATPSHCGTYEIAADFMPWASPSASYRRTSSFDVSSGPGGGPCPAPGALPFHPGFSAGSVNNAAAAFSPFVMRFTRQDGDQDLTRFSAILPRGVTGKLAGVAKCPDSAIAAAREKTGLQERAEPSCPGASRVGGVLGGAGVGSQLTYVQGSAYLAGPYNGDPLSVVAVVPAVAGPFDAGTVVTRVALAVNPETAEVEVDEPASDPIPRILKGIPLKVREVRVVTDRPNFTLNPTSCRRSATRATVFGGFADLFSPADDVPVSLSERYQAASCASLPFEPKLAFRLKGGTRRGAFPAFSATVTARPGDANIGRTVVTFPHSTFLEQAHIRTVCTRVQFRAHQCPDASAYGMVRATTPLLDEALEGPVYLRSSDHPLPDLVFALKGIVEVEVVARIDSVKGRIRATFDSPPDVPVSQLVVQMQGGKKGLIVNSRDLCAHRSRMVAELSGQNGRLLRATPLLRPGC